MVNAGILKDDIAIIRQLPASALENGKIVAALDDYDRLIIRTLISENGDIFLQEKNRSAATAIVTDSNKVVGEVIGIYRPEIH